METIATTKRLDLEELSEKITSWLSTHGWHTAITRVSNNIWEVIGTKESYLRDFFCTRGKVYLSIKRIGMNTKIEIDDKSFGDNWGANAAWIVATGGTNLLLTATGKIGIHRLAEYIKGLV